jgi:hypothetical protein
MGRKRSKPGEGLKSIMYYGEGAETPQEPQDASDDSVRINIRVSRKTLAWLKDEAKDSATSVSALCSLAIYDWVEDRQARERIEMSDAVRAALKTLTEDAIRAQKK